MKILVVSFYYTPELGAAPSRITNMAEGLKNQGVEVDVLTCLPNYPKGRIFEGYRRRFCKHEVIRGIHVYRYWAFATVSKNPLLRILGMLSFSFLLWCFALRFRKVKSYDGIIVQSPPIMVAHSAIFLFKKVFRKKVVLNVSDLWPMSAVELGAVREGSLYHRVLERMERFIYKGADAIQGQSNEILRHIKTFVPEKPLFLYRNLQHALPAAPQEVKEENAPFRIVYAGLLGVAQDLLSLVENINFKELGAELHLYGGGNQTSKIEHYIQANDTGVTYHGYLPKEKVTEVLRHHDASIVPLAVNIKGAVPSKIFDLLPVSVPILLCGGGEAAEIVRNYGLGYTSKPKDYEGLKQNIRHMIGLSGAERLKLQDNCLKASETDFSFDKQMEKYVYFLRQRLLSHQAE